MSFYNFGLLFCYASNVKSIFSGCYAEYNLKLWQIGSFNVPNKHRLCCSMICMHELHLSSLPALTYKQLAFKGQYLMFLYLSGEVLIAYM